LRLLKEEYASELFAEFTPKQQTDIIKMLTSEEIADLFEEMYTDEAVDILEELPTNITHKILASTNKEQRAKINKILRYDIGKCGYHMVVEYVSIGDNLTIGQAKEIAKNQINEEDLEIIGNIFVSSSEDGRMIGYIKPDVLIAGNDNDMIIDEIERIEGVQSTDHISKAQALISQYDIPSVPVLDNNHVIVGIIEADDIIERYEDIDEASFDQSTINVINKSYLDVTNKELIIARLP
jgi:magnesium transporter